VRDAAVSGGAVASCGGGGGGGGGAGAGAAATSESCGRRELGLGAVLFAE
jgi:hypothetical protein